MRPLMIGLGILTVLLPSVGLANTPAPFPPPAPPAPPLAPPNLPPALPTALPPLPRTDERAPAPMTITYQDGRAQVIIPKKLAGATALTAVSDDEAPVHASSRTAVAGLALSAGLIVGGLWFVRRNRTITTPAMVAAIGVGLALTAAVAFADIAPFPGRKRPEPPRKNQTLDLSEIKAGQAKLTIDVTVVDRGDTIQLVLPKALAPAPKAEPATDQR